MKRPAFGIVLAAILMAACGSKQGLPSEGMVAGIINDWSRKTFEAWNPAGGDPPQLHTVVALNIRPHYVTAILGEASPPKQWMALAVILPVDDGQPGWAVSQVFVYRLFGAAVLEHPELQAHSTRHEFSAGLARARQTIPAGAAAETRQWWNTFIASHHFTLTDQQAKELGKFIDGALR